MNKLQQKLKEILHSLSQDMISEAYDEVKDLVSGCEHNMNLNDKLDMVEVHVLKLLSGKTTDITFPQKMEQAKSAFHDIQHSLYGVAVDAVLCQLSEKNPVYMQLSQKGNHVHIEDVEQRIGSFLSEDAMLHIESGLSQKMIYDKEIAIQTKLNDYREEVFSYLFTDTLWTEKKRDAMEKLLLSPILDEVSAQIFLSAITLSCMNIFDGEKYLFLLKTYKEATVLAVKVRAFVGLVLCDAKMPEFFEKEGLYSKYISLAKEEDDFLDDLYGLQRWLVVSKCSEALNENLAHSLFKEVLGRTNHMLAGESEEERVKRLTSDVDEDEELSENMEETIEDIGNRERKGYDLYIEQFRVMTLKNKFFDKLYNWFLPFDEQQPIFKNYIAKQKKGRDMLKVMHDHTELCDTDLYGFMFLVEKHPEMADSLCSQIPEEMAEEMKQDIKTYGKARLMRNYVRVLYRFYKFANKSHDFFDPFTELRDNNGTPYYCILCSPHYDDPAFHLVRMKALKMSDEYESADLALSIYNLVDKPIFEADDHINYAIALLNRDEPGDAEKAVAHIDAALKMEPDNIKVHRLVLLNPVSKSSEIIRSALFLLDYFKVTKDSAITHDDASIDEEEVFDVKMELMKAYIQERQLEAALKIAFEMDYNNPGNDEVAAVIAYCLLHRNPIKVDPANIKKAEEIADSYLADDMTTELKKTFGGNDMPEVNDILKSLAGIFLNAQKKSPTAECVLDYCKVLCALSRHDIKVAMDYMVRGLLAKCDHENNAKGFLYGLLFPYGVEWLSQFGYDEKFVSILYQRAYFKLSQLNKIKDNAFRK